MEIPDDNRTTMTTLCEVNDTLHNNLSPDKLSTTVSVISCGSGLPLNIYVVWLIIRGTGSSIESDFFFLNLALTDILFFTGFLMTPFLRFCPKPLFKATGLFFAFIATGHPLFQMCICVERYLAVLHPVLFQKYRPLRYRVACSAIVWVMVLPSCVLFLLDRNAAAIFWPTVNLIVFPVVIFCCLAVLRALCKPGPGDRQRDRAGANQVKVRAFRIIAVITFTQFIILIANIISCYARVLEDIQKQLTYDMTLLIMISAFLVQPLLFLHRAGKLPSRATC
ncbi:hypothetical protein ACEWY4_015236 [Coilia grayii]|uniref:G-protein coupled receptors family 1 profile domain-containing protein n=1 Tax=Coilia grayii TaxID=363190 RepID=A0ABD1JMH8_9TELE